MLDVTASYSSVSYSSYLTIVFVAACVAVSTGSFENINVTPECQLKEEGQNATFHCNTADLNNPQLTWCYDQANEVLSISGSNIVIKKGNGFSTLTIINVTSYNNGNYICRASANYSSSNSTGVLLVPFCEARGPLPLEITVHVTFGMNVTLACPLFGFPPPAIKWTHPDGRNETDFFTNILHFNVHNESNTGSYICSGCTGRRFDFHVKKYEIKFEEKEADKQKTDCKAPIIAIGVLVPALLLAIIVLSVLLFKVKKSGQVDVGPQPTE